MTKWTESAELRDAQEWTRLSDIRERMRVRREIVREWITWVSSSDIYTKNRNTRNPDRLTMTIIKTYRKYTKFQRGDDQPF